MPVAPFNDSSFLPLNPPKAATCFIRGSSGRSAVVALQAQCPRKLFEKVHDFRVSGEVSKRAGKLRLHEVAAAASVHVPTL